MGSGAGGSVAACVLAEAGHRVLLLERGGVAPFTRDHLRNQRLSLYGHSAGPDPAGDPRELVESGRPPRTVHPHENGYHNNAAVVGGGTAVFGAQAWRFPPLDFAMASEYGVPPGSSLADWPFGYDELEPYYTQAEQELGVAGSPLPHRWQGPRSQPYPMPPLPDTRSRHVLRRGGERLGWALAPVPVLINTVPYRGRPACPGCQHCVGFVCPHHSKNGTQQTLIPRALATGRCDLRSGCTVERLETDPGGKVTGVSYLTGEGAAVRRVSVRSTVVVVAAGAIESARLLLLSADRSHPRGLGNDHDQVGRHLQGHVYTGAWALLEEPVYDGIGPGVSLATCQFNHGNPGIIGGGMLADDFIRTPITHWLRGQPPEQRRWGRAARQALREQFPRTLQVVGPVQDIPNPDSRVTLSPTVRDQFGLPVARLSGTAHPETLRTAAFLHGRARDWLQACGAVRVWGEPPGPGLSAGQHQAGTCRMGEEPRTSVTDPWGRVHGHDNLYVMDGSLHVTNGGLNPVLTILALAFRNARHLAGRL